MVFSHYQLYWRKNGTFQQTEHIIKSDNCSTQHEIPKPPSTPTPFLLWGSLPLLQPDRLILQRGNIQEKVVSILPKIFMDWSHSDLEESRVKGPLHSHHKHLIFHHYPSQDWRRRVVRKKPCITIMTRWNCIQERQGRCCLKPERFIYKARVKIMLIRYVSTQRRGQPSKWAEGGRRQCMSGKCAVNHRTHYKLYLCVHLLSQLDIIFLIYFKVVLHQ